MNTRLARLARRGAPLSAALVALVATTVLVGVACSVSTTSSGGPSTDGGPDSTSPLSEAGASDANPLPVTDAMNADALADGGANADAADDAPTSDGGTDAADGAAASPYRGAIFATSDSTTAADGGAQVDYSAGGYFVHRTAPDLSVTESTVGPCLVQVYGSGAGPVETSLSGGSVQITGGKKTLTLVPTAAKDYTTLQASTSDLWNGGETITVTAGGADVPAFTTSLVAPSKITLTSPALPAPTGALNVPRNAPWSATWTGTSSGVVVLYFDAADGSGAYAATCSFDAAAGTGQVPAAAFASFPAGSGTFNFYVKTTATPAVAGWDIHFNATSRVVDGAGTGAGGATTYP